MDPLQLPEIPASWLEFAKAIAAVCDEHKVDHCEVSFRQNRDLIRGGYGSLKFFYRSTDGRGRPSRGLVITAENIRIEHALIDEPQSSN